MPENDFEKRVQQKMEELKLQPAEPVWKKIEETIREKKRKRRVLFFIPLFAGLLLLGYTGYRYLRPGTGSRVREENISSLNKTKSNDLSTPKDDTIKSKNSVDISMKQGNADPQDKEIIPSVASVEKKVYAGGIPSKRKDRSALTKKQDAGDDIDKAPNEKLLAGKISKIDNNSISKNDEQAGQTKKDAEVNNSGNIVKQDVTGNDSLKNRQTTVATGQKEIPATAVTGKIDSKEIKTDSVTQKIVKKKTAASSRWGLDFSAGVSDIRKKALSFSSSSWRTADFGSISTGQSPGYSTLPSSETMPGPALKLGATWEKNITKRSKFSTGLYYNYFSNRIKVGTRTNAPAASNPVNQTLTSYYSGIQQNKFTNHYHFAEWPVNYQVQLNKNDITSFIWNIGVSVSRLIATNALVYDTAAGGIYYHSNRLFNKTHFNVLTGLSFRLKNKNNMEWYIGPQLSIDMTRLMKKEDGNNRFLLAGWLDARLLFPRKLKK
jgi:hypothetical protein